jgi:hypothetical protein
MDSGQGGAEGVMSENILSGCLRDVEYIRYRMGESVLRTRRSLSIVPT